MSEEMWGEIWAGNGGWVVYRHENLLGPVFVRFEDRAGRLVPVDLFLYEDSGLRVETLRLVPLGRIEAWANSGHTADAIWKGILNAPGPDLRTAASFFNTRVEQGTTGLIHTNVIRPFQPNMEGWAERMLAAQFPEGEKYRSIRQPLESSPTRRRKRVDTRLNVPLRQPYGDKFYESVARAYGRLLEQEASPAPIIASANSVPITTVHRWIREARKRGFLPPAQPGKAG